ncbi:hypothetical protein ZWY2020_050327 [Hordeum vulgare]|nr:hypothetical protein ZWY2020_050327 [Hordeum vulgare]
MPRSFPMPRRRIASPTRSSPVHFPPHFRRAAAPPHTSSPLPSGRGSTGKSGPLAGPYQPHAGADPTDLGVESRQAWLCSVGFTQFPDDRALWVAETPLPEKKSTTFAARRPPVHQEELCTCYDRQQHEMRTSGRRRSTSRGQAAS